MKSIDLRAANLASFTYNNKWYYTALSDFPLRSASYREALENALPEAWEMKDSGIWRMVRQKTHVLIPDGFKIHISVLPQDALELLQAVLPILFRRLAAFKIPRDHSIHDFLNSQNSGRGNAGKFMTVYPSSTAEFKSLLAELHSVTQNFAGPYILSDKRYLDSQCLYYRYGAFLSNPEINVQGQFKATLVGPHKTPDSRLPWFELPEGISDPFPTETSADGTSLLNGRYEIQEALAPHSTKGGVYLAKDHVSGDTVVLKEARPFINQSMRDRTDTVVGLRHEAHILKRIGSFGITPRYLDHFQEWEHHFLVMDYLPMANLRNYAGEEGDNLFITSGLDSANQNRFVRRSAQLLLHLLDAVLVLHGAGIVMGDLAPQNVLYDRETLAVKLIDFEGAYDEENDVFFRGMLTPGFTVMPKEKPSEASDLKAVANMVLHMLLPMCQFFSLHPDARPGFLEGLLREKELPLAFLDFFRALPDDPSAAKAALLPLCQGPATDWRTALPYPTEPTLATSTATDSILAYYLRDLQRQVKNAVFPGDYRVFHTNPLNIAFGAWGVAAFFHAVDAQLPQAKLDEILQLSEELSPAQYPPGFYIGSSGIACVMLQMGYTELALRTMDTAYASPLLQDSADLFQGAAGWGLASLYFYQATSLPRYLDAALEAAEAIRKLLKRDDSGLYYEQESGHVYGGLMHGAAGIAFFFTQLYQFTHSERDKATAMDLMAYELAHAEEGKERGMWRREYEAPTTFPYMRFGGAGIGMVLLRMYKVFGDASHLAWAEDIGGVLKAKCSLQPGLFLGMAGIGHFFIDLYQTTGNPLHLQEAHAYARRILRYQVPGDHGIAFPGDMLLRLSLDYGTGSAGIGMFLHRLQHPETEGMFLMDLLDGLPESRKPLLERVQA